MPATDLDQRRRTGSRLSVSGCRHLAATKNPGKGRPWPSAKQAGGYKNTANTEPASSLACLTWLGWAVSPASIVLHTRSFALIKTDLRHRCTENSDKVLGPDNHVISSWGQTPVLHFFPCTKRRTLNTLWRTFVFQRPARGESGSLLTMAPLSSVQNPLLSVPSVPSAVHSSAGVTAAPSWTVQHLLAQPRATTRQTRQTRQTGASDCSVTVAFRAQLT